jgi:predicted MPP superfamily phosphohydrolase
MKKTYILSVAMVLATIIVSAQQASFTFVHIADLHVSTVSSAVNQCDINGVEAKCYLHTFNNLSPKPAFILATGDISNIGNSTAVSGGMYTALTQYLYPQGLQYPAPGALFIDSAQTIPFYFAPGNHDYYTTLLPPGTLTQLNTLPNYTKYIGPDSDYAITTPISVILFVRSGWDISYLISTDPKGSGLTDAQIAWIRTVLSQNSNKRKIIVMHHPPSNHNGTNCDGSAYTQVSDSNTSAFYVNRTEFLDICDSNHVDIVLAGHQHENVVVDRAGNVISENCDTCGTRFVQTGPAFAGCYRTITVDSAFVTVSTPGQSCPSTTSGIQEENELEISVYPDPSNGLFTVNLGRTLATKLKVFNILGACVYQQSSASSSIQVDMRSQPEGMYFLQIVADQDGTQVTYNFKYSVVISK